MGFEGANRLAVRENAVAPDRKGAIRCPRCNEPNPAGTTRCRACFTTLPSKAAPPATPAPSAPRTVRPTVDPARKEVDSILGELEALTQRDRAPAAQFQCPQCGRIVDEAATRCACGALFADPSGIIGYECPLCGTRVPENATQCRCGARFAD